MNNVEMSNTKVSIITPMFNSEKFILSAINSVLSQTYTNWELLIIDDCSTDNSKRIVHDCMKHDKRIVYIGTEKPSGSPSIPRNIGINKASGRFIAFLDSDDLWLPNKLEKQISYFKEEKVVIVYSNYEKISEEGISSNRIVLAPKYCSYENLLKGNVIACCTCVYDSYKIGKMYLPNQGHEDYALWLKILRNGFLARNAGLVLAKYRVRKSSISSNKLNVIFWLYNIYRKNEKKSLFLSIYYTFIALVKSFFKYLK